MPSLSDLFLQPSENLQKWLTDEKARDQFVIQSGSDTEVLWNDARHLKPEPVYKRSFWTESFVQWSPLGTYLATVHRQGAAVWGGATTFNRLMRYAHPQVKLIDFSPGENFLVTYRYSSHEPSNPRDTHIINGPEVLSKFVGETEKNVRDLFADAEQDRRTRGDQSDLHVIIFDEIDAICKSRGSTRDGTGVHDSIVNQLLTKIDGVESLNKVLLIGMTNRKDLLDEALLRPGRLEVQVEISLPDENGRFQILQIHTNKMEENSFLAPDINLQELDNFRSPLHGSNEQLAEHAMSTDKEGNLAGGDWILVDGGERERDLFPVFLPIPHSSYDQARKDGNVSDGDTERVLWVIFGI